MAGRPSVIQPRGLAAWRRGVVRSAPTGIPRSCPRSPPRKNRKSPRTTPWTTPPTPRWAPPWLSLFAFSRGTNASSDTIEDTAGDRAALPCELVRQTEKSRKFADASRDLRIRANSDLGSRYKPATYRATPVADASRNLLIVRAADRAGGSAGRARPPGSRPLGELGTRGPAIASEADLRPSRAKNAKCRGPHLARRDKPATDEFSSCDSVARQSRTPQFETRDNAPRLAHPTAPLRRRGHVLRCRQGSSTNQPARSG
jgi:hypothetical protein